MRKVSACFASAALTDERARSAQAMVAHDRAQPGTCREISRKDGFFLTFAVQECTTKTARQPQLREPAVWGASILRLHLLLSASVRRASLAVCGALIASGAALSEPAVRVGIYSNPPKVLSKAEGGPGGVYVEILRSVSKVDGRTFDYQDRTFNDGLNEVLSGDLDLMVDVALTPERRQVFDFSDPVLQSWSSVYVRKDSRISTVNDLADKRVAVLAGSLQQQQMQAVSATAGLHLNVVGMDTYEAAFDAVRRGQVDAVASNPFFGGPDHAGLRETSVIFGESTYHFVVRKGTHADLLDLVNRRIAEVKADPRSVYFRSFRELRDSRRGDRLPSWVPGAALALTVILLLTVAWAAAYRRVAARLRVSEQNQRRLANELGRIFDNSVDVVLVAGEDLRVRRVSPACRAWGYEQADVVGQPCGNFVAAQLRTRALREIRRVQRGHRAKSFPGVCLRRDGSAVPVTWSAAWLPEQRELYVSVRDDSERAVLMTALRQKNEQLESANIDLQVVSSSLSHDLRSPLAAVQVFTARAVELLPQPAAMPEIGRMLQRAIAAGAKMDAMVDDLAAMLRVAGHDIHLQVCDVTALARRLCHDVRGATGAHDHVEVEIADGLQVRADPRLLQIALENLIGNAFKFSARTEQPRVEIGRIPTGGAEVVLFVRDNGCGFDPAYADKLFRPFSRLHTQSEFPGTGLGLSIAQRVVQRHRGRLWAESAPGRGATFFLSLPD
jgi:PAS domain S-box-containing protein